jgi:putative ABC transport system permease protein
MSPRLYAQLGWRECRRSIGRILLFMACIAVGVAAVVVVAGLSQSVQQGVRSEGRRLMAADLAVEARRELPPELDAALQQFQRQRGIAVQRTNVREFVSIVAAKQDASVLAEVKVVDGDYPFYGNLVLDPPGKLADLLTDQTAVVAPELLARLGLKTGDDIRLGGASFRVAAQVLEEPDKVSITFTLGPRVFISSGGLNRTALMGMGSRVEYRALLKLPDGTPSGVIDRLEQQLEAAMPNDGYRVRTFVDAQPQLRRSFDRMGRYLGLVGLLSLLVGGVGVAQVARAWIASRLDDIAILRCLGARPGEVVLLFVLQIVVMSLVASMIGAAIGTALHGAVPHMLGNLLPADLIHPFQPLAILRGVLLGIGTALVFTLPLLAGLKRVPPVRVLRRDAEPLDAGRGAQVLGAVLVLGGVWASASAQAESMKYGSIFIAGLIGAIACLALVASGVSRIARLLPRERSGVRLRHGLAHLSRPGAATLGAIVALGLGVTFVFATRVVQRNLSEQLSAELPAEAPTTFFLDIQPDQWLGIQAMLENEGATGIDSRPIVTGRFTAINGVPVSTLVDDSRRDNNAPSRASQDQPRPRRWVLTREQRLTYGASLPRGNRVIEGAFPAPNVSNAVSIEEGFAEDLGVRVGSHITFDVQGVPVELSVGSIRTIDWRTFGINFFVFAQPGPLDDAPQMRVAVARLNKPDAARIQTAVVNAFPNVTVIQIQDVMEKVLTVLDRLGLAVKVLGAFTVAAGIVVLGGTVAATQARRAREVALLKTVGMTRRDVICIFAIEYALNGTVAAIIGVFAGGVLAWGVITRLLDLPWTMPLGDAAVFVVVATALAVASGLLASARALAARPIEVLRTE